MTFHAASTKKKSTKNSESTVAPEAAILAIEIVDGNENSTGLRNNTKRTIESALGYGYQGNYYPTSAGKKFMIYPYSQQDIPAPTKSHGVSGEYQDLNIQKSVSYNLGTKIEAAAQISKDIFTPNTKQDAAYSQEQSYYPSTLFSTVNQGGMVGDLSASFPSQHPTASTTVPVIILRVYTNQLADQAIYPNLPQSHPYANNLNSINLQSILSNYIQQYMYQMTQQMQKHPYQYQSSYPSQSNNNNLIYQEYSGQNYYQMPQTTYQQYQQSHVPKAVAQDVSQHSHNHALPTSENYPSDSHTRVIYHGPKGHLPSSTYPNKITSSNQQYAKQQSAAAAYAANSQEVFTDANGQNFVYLYPSQIKALHSQNQGYYQPQSYQQDYVQDDQQQYVSQAHEYQSPQAQEDRQYLPTPAPPEKIYNYHAEAIKERTKKRSNGPITFQQKLQETTVKKN